MKEQKGALLVQRPVDKGGAPDTQAFFRAIVLNVEALFSRNRSVNLPWSQRAFAWRNEHVTRFVACLLEKMRAPQQRYSLGQVWFGGAAGASKAKLVDGYQRAIVLTMLCAILRDQTAIDERQPKAERDADHARLNALIAAPPSGPRWRLVPEAQLAMVFERFVQAPGGTILDPGAGYDDLTLAERHLLACRNQLREMLVSTEWTPFSRHEFIGFVLERCFLLAIEVDDEDEALAMFGVEQATRLPHDVAEESKIALVHAMPTNEQEQANQIWTQCQSELGCEGVAELLQCLRSAKLAKRSTMPLDGELREMYRLDRRGLDFMLNEFQVGARNLGAIAEKNIGAGAAKAAVSRQIERLSWLDHRQWVAPALVWLAKKGADHAETLRFFALLDRLAWMLKIAATDPLVQENCFIGACAAAARRQPVDRCAEFILSDRTITDALNALRSRTFYFKHAKHLVMRRLCALLGSDPGSIDGIKVSIEHVLPRRPSKDKRWWSEFPSKDAVLDFTDRLGNLALLTGRQNQAADCSDWEVKREFLRTSTFSLATEAATYERWTKQTIEARTEKLIAVLLAPWGIAVA